MSHDLNALVGAYVLDALSDDERTVFEDHLRTCVDCTAEVLGLQETAAELTHLTAAEPPAFLRENVLAGIDQIRPLPPLADNVVVLRRSLMSRVWPALAAAAAVVALLVGGWGISEHRAAEHATAKSDAFTSLVAAPDAKTYTAHMKDGSTATVVVSRKLNEFALVADRMPGVAHGKTYQLWTMDAEGKATSAGLFTPSTGRTVVTSDVDLTKAATIGVSVEKAGGADTPTLSAVVTTVGI